MTETIIQIILFIVLFFCTILMPIGIPANFISTATVLVYYLVADNGVFTIWYFVTFLALAIVGEVIEQVTGAMGAKKYGASKKGMLGAFLGGILGAIVGTMIIPVIGSIVGVFLGAFVCTLVFELIFAKKNMSESVKAGKGAVIGKFLAVSAKYAIGFGMLITIACRFWLRDKPPVIENTVTAMLLFF